MRIPMHRPNVCTNLPNLLLCPTTTTPSPTTADSPHHPHPPSPRSPYGTSGSSYACSSSASTSTSHRSEPATRMGIHATTTTLPMSSPGSSPNSRACPTMPTTLHTTMLRSRPSLSTSLSTHVLQEAIIISYQPCTYRDSDCEPDVVIYGVVLWCIFMASAVNSTSPRKRPNGNSLRWRNNNIYVRTFCRIFCVLVTNLCAPLWSLKFPSEFK